MTAHVARRAVRRAIPAILVAMVLAVLTVASPAQARVIRSEFFGMHDSDIVSGSLPGVTTGAVRLWDTGTHWRRIETSPGVFDWSRVDSAVDTARDAGLRPLLVLGQTPQFHARNPRVPGAFGDGATSMPVVRAWKRYVSKTARHYGNRVDYQVWNEPSVDSFWTGTVPQMARLTAIAGATITRVVGRRATVVAPAFPNRLGSQQKWFRSYWSTESGGKPMTRYVDVVALNLYPMADQGPEASMNLLRIARQALPRSARGMPVWNTEINYGIIDGKKPAKKISASKQAAFVARTYLLNAANGVSRVYFFRWAIGPIANTRLVQDDGTTLTRAGRAYEVVHEWLIGTDVKGCTQARQGKADGVYTCTARAGRREVHRFYWKPSGRAVGITTHRTARSWTDLTGDTRQRNGPFRIKVGPSPVMVTSRR